ncbi:MAG: hypothetical protein ABIQ50_00350 [Usitatibacter sp.]
MGKALDAEGLRRVISLGDPALVQAFWIGTPDQGAMPADIEALVVKYFSDPKLGESIRDFRMLYSTRALFDRFYAQARAAFIERDPVWGRILRTNQPGIEEDILRIVDKFPAPSTEMNPALVYLAARRYPAAIPLLLASMERSNRWNSAVILLANYESVEVWRKAKAEVDRLKGAGKMDEKHYAEASALLRPLLEAPTESLARRRTNNAQADFARQRKPLERVAQAGGSQSDPVRQVEARARLLAQLDKIASEFQEPAIMLDLADEYAALGIAARMRAGDMQLSVKYLERAARDGSGFGQFALGDAYELGAGDKANAIRAYQMALETAKSSRTTGLTFGLPDSPANKFWKAWLPAQIQYLRSGKQAKPALTEPVIAGYWQAMRFRQYQLRPELPELPRGRFPAVRMESSASYSSLAIDPTQRQRGWPAIEHFAASVDRASLQQQLAALPPSRFVFMTAIRFISLLKSPDEILKEFSRHDPGGYWTTIAMATVNFHEKNGRDGALVDGVAEALPGMSAPERPNALAKAAARYMKQRDVRPVGTQ